MLERLFMGFHLSRNIPWPGQILADQLTLFQPGAVGRLGPLYFKSPPPPLQIFRMSYDPAEWPAGSSKSMYMM